MSSCGLRDDGVSASSSPNDCAIERGKGAILLDSVDCTMSRMGKGHKGGMVGTPLWQSIARHTNPRSRGETTVDKTSLPIPEQHGSGNNLLSFN